MSFFIYKKRKEGVIILDISKTELEQILQETTLTYDVKITFIDFFLMYKTNDFIYPGLIKKDTDIAIEKIYYSFICTKPK